MPEPRVVRRRLPTKKILRERDVIDQLRINLYPRTQIRRFEGDTQGTVDRLTREQIDNIKEGYPGFLKHVEEVRKTGGDETAAWNRFLEEERRAAARTELLEKFDLYLRDVPWTPRSHAGRLSEGLKEEQFKKNLPHLFEEHIQRVEADAKAYVKGRKQSLEYMQHIRHERRSKFWRILNPFFLIRHPIGYIGNFFGIASDSGTLRRARKRHRASELLEDPFLRLVAQTQSDLSKLFNDFQRGINWDKKLDEATIRELGSQFRDRLIAIIDNYEKQSGVAVGWGILGAEYAKNALELSRRQGITPGAQLSEYLKGRKGKRLARATRKAEAAAARVEARGKGPEKSSEEEG
ncbi:MAG: hypothetical protein NT067_04330 [Candidatus Diapherotrites archaeon]|nr:hypothetical protein [Candidatus Diapherotrites archaeon]